MARRSKQGSLAPVLLFFGMATFGSATPVSRIVGTAFPPMLAGLLRVGLGSALLLFAARRRWPGIRAIVPGDWARIGGVALFGMFGFSVLMLYGMQQAPGAVGAMIMSMTPVVTALAAMLLGERFSLAKLAAVGLAVAGAVILELGQGLRDESGKSVLDGALLVFGAVCCEAAYTLLGQRLSKRVDPVLSAALGAVLSLPLFALGAALLGGWSVTGAGMSAWFALGWYGAGTLALGSWLWYRGIAQVSGLTAAAFMGVMPLSALGLSYVLLGEPFRPIHLLGFGTVFAGVLLISWEHGKAGGSGRRRGSR